jgi:hypothetical protein
LTASTFPRETDRSTVQALPSDRVAILLTTIAVALIDNQMNNASGKTD